MSRGSLLCLAVALSAVLCETGCIKRSKGDTTFIYNSKEQPSGGYSGSWYRPNRFERPATTLVGMCGDCRVSGGTCAPCKEHAVAGEQYCNHCREAEVFCDPCRKAGE